MKLYDYAVLVLILGVGNTGGYVFGVRSGQDDLMEKLTTITPLREHNPEYQFIDPLLAYIIPSIEQEERLTVLQDNIQKEINHQKRLQNLSDASVFLSDLNRGRWIGVNESQKYKPARILKVVIMVAYFKESESAAGILKKELTYTSELDAMLKQNPSHTPSLLKIGASYAIEELIEKMITGSDNGAEVLLLSNINPRALNNIYTVLNIDNPDQSIGDFTISPRQYSLFFRILYSSTYLQKNLSEKALEILSRTTFNEGIIAGISEDVVVSHKFGEYVDQENQQVKSVELHDCGIVYYDQNPYFLCVMTKGSNLSNLKEVIKNISSLVYRGYE